MESNTPTPRTDDLAHELWGRWPILGEIEVFDLARQLERELNTVVNAAEELVRVFKTGSYDEWSEALNALKIVIIAQSKQRDEHGR